MFALAFAYPFALAFAYPFAQTFAFGLNLRQTAIDALLFEAKTPHGGERPVSLAIDARLVGLDDWAAAVHYARDHLPGLDVEPARRTRRALEEYTI